MKQQLPSQFDASYYKRFYVRKTTRATSRLETEKQSAVVAAVVAQLNIPVRRILDMGCGLGWFKRPLLKTFPKARYHGVEYSEYLCSRQGWEQGSVVDYRGRGLFDLVICNDVIQYLDERAATRALNNLTRLCRGALYLHVPTRSDWEHAMDPSGTDTQVFIRDGGWYRRLLRRHFTHAGQGVLVRQGVPFLQWELHSPWS